ncbi:phosphatidylinositol-specific phospholipase C [Xenorhabdus sp. KK7.4]|uniref:phosphatidylinositol-specific phospholipase C n=1 Tax=Xenorhabdus sp. KK7.4 TaxID=1851572 RepID=UPI000C03A0A8|nr:phosphatidylinositol-specific phospholipase C [Xenorhabdus sp. KK7.4]PHM54476.1 PlcA [Xenorhabdus sp. KK7.4]
MKKNKKTVNFDYTDNKKITWEPTTWMKNIDDKKSTALLSIPGTHESCATYSPEGDVLGIIICQNQSVEQQLQEGIRFLDIRCRAIDGVFTIHHEMVYQKINFGDVLIECINFLSSHPSETIFMRVKQEYSTVSDKDFIAIFNDHYGKFYPYMYLDSDIPSLGQVRGKIVIISNVSGLPGIPWNVFKIQDDYDADDAFEKWEAICEHFSLTIKNHSSGGKDFFINFLSIQGNPPHWTIKKMSYNMNGSFITMLQEGVNVSGLGVGIIPMDFPNLTDNVIGVIIDSNF